MHPSQTCCSPSPFISPPPSSPPLNSPAPAILGQIIGLPFNTRRVACPEEGDVDDDTRAVAGAIYVPSAGECCCEDEVAAAALLAAGVLRPGSLAAPGEGASGPSASEVGGDGSGAAVITAAGSGAAVVLVAVIRGSGSAPAPGEGADGTPALGFGGSGDGAAAPAAAVHGAPPTVCDGDHEVASAVAGRHGAAAAAVGEAVIISPAAAAATAGQGAAVAAGGQAAVVPGSNSLGRVFPCCLAVKLKMGSGKWPARWWITSTSICSARPNTATSYSDATPSLASNIPALVPESPCNCSPPLGVDILVWYTGA
ncbi:unnamed protein product [Ectocarpus sp. CCAP 1310/34]|nr:unnamed protein product [Ectocarpus sp. CCAP 1310/34]